MAELIQKPENKLSQPHEELVFLREKLSELEKKIETGEQEPPLRDPAEALSRAYGEVSPKEVLTPEAILPPEVAEAIVLDLPPEKHDEQMAELLGILRERGVRNTLSVVEKMNNPHIEDDFHRFLSEYIREGHAVKAANERDPLYKALKMTLYEVSLPPADKDEEKKTELKKLISSMEQFYAGMRAIGDAKSGRSFALEIAQSNEREDVVFYISVPREYEDLFEKNIVATFHNARVERHNADYNIFSEDGVSAASVAKLSKNSILPIKTYEAFDVDPLNVILNAFSKLKKEGEGAAVQLIFRSAPEGTEKGFKKIVDKVQTGTSLKDAIGPEGFGGAVKEFGKDALKDLLFPSKKSDDKPKDTKVDELGRDMAKKKIEAPLFSVNLLIVTSAENTERAEAIRRELESAFNQFEEGAGNRFSFLDLSGTRLTKALRRFSFRLFDETTALTLNTKELTTIAHFPSADVGSATQLKTSKAGTAPAPLELPQDGILLGINSHRGRESEIRFMPEDRLRHFYAIGQTGTGKTTLLKNMIVQDIKNGEGVCFIDPHGTDITDILANVPQERAQDVIYFDPAYTPRPMALNMLEYDLRYPEQKSFVVDELLSIFNKLFDMKTAGGPMFEQYFRNAALLVMEDPASGSTLIDLSRILADKKFRDMKLSKSGNPIVVQFWREVAEKAGGEASLQNIIPYITSKFDVFLTNEIMRPVIAQEKSTFNFREVMDTKKILLVNLSKGRLGEINANLIGLILVGKILMAALSRVDSAPGSLPPFYLYIDEFQNVTTDSISSILSEARKYGLGLTIAHQFIKQLEEGIKDAVFGNVGSVCAFRVSVDDAEYLEKQFTPIFSANDLMNLDNRNAYVKMLMNGKPEKPFNIHTIKPDDGNPAVVEELKQLSYRTYGRDRTEVEAEVMARYRKEPTVLDDRPPLR